MDRRELLRRGALVAGGALAGSLARSVPATAASSEQFAGRHTDEHRLSHAALLWRVDTPRRVVALTFDDGPTPTYTPAVQRILAEQQVPATFFLIGRQVRRNPELVLPRRMAGHEVGNHTWSHRDLGALDAPTALDELELAHREIHRVTGTEPTVMRPPYGRISGAALLAAGTMGYPVVLWSMEMHERSASTEQNAAHITAAATPGTILLGHDGGPGPHWVGIRALPRVVAGLRRQGYAFLTASQMLAVARIPSPRAPLAPDRGSVSTA